MTVDLALGARPEEPGPPIGGETAYPADVLAQLDADAAMIVARYHSPVLHCCRCCIWCSLRMVTPPRPESVSVQDISASAMPR